jgi:quaternary ammonium compound-resistance protein SugE
MAWFILFIAGLFEIAWVVALKYSQGFTKLIPSIIMLITLGVSMALLSYAVKTLPVGTAYVVWTGIGAVGAAVMGIFLFDESREVLRLVFMFLIVVGIVGLKMVSN